MFTRPARNEYSVLAVISGFRAVNEPVHAGTNPVYAGDGKPVMFRYNTGIIVAWSVDFAVRLIEANPVGANRRAAG